MLDKVKLSLRITTDAFDNELTDLIEAAKRDLNIAGVKHIDDTDSLIITAIITYVKAHFGDPGDYERLKMSYDEQKAQLGMASGYTIWGDGDG